MKSILIIVPYDDVYPPMNGGMQRCFHIIHQLALYFDLTVITFQSKQELLTAAKQYPAISKIKIISTKDIEPAKDVFSLFPQRVRYALRYRWIKKQLQAPADGMFLTYYPALKKAIKSKRYDAIILENLSTLNAISIIRKYDENVKIIYDAHNVDSNLAAHDVDKTRIRKIESSLHETVNGLFVCSDTDQLEFEKMNKQPLNVRVIPNGVEVGAVQQAVNDETGKRRILFCGFLDSVPNSEGLLWFYKNIWNQLQHAVPDIELIVVGSGQLPAEARVMRSDPSIIFSGAVENVKPWYEKAELAIVPLLSGSGTRLKILEAMSLGLPVVSTSKGAEGIDYTDGENIIIADDADCFKNSIVDLLTHLKKKAHIKSEARKLVQERYEWNKIGAVMKDFLLTDVLI